MLSCLYRGRLINAFMVDESQEYQERKHIRLELIKAGREDALLCQDCGHPVILRAGEKKTPHFAHKQGFRAHCPYIRESIRESEVHKKGKRILYHYFRRKYPDAEVQVDLPLPCRRKANLFVIRKDEKLAVEFQRFQIDPVEWDAKQRDYHAVGLPCIWIISGSRREVEGFNDEKDMLFYKQMVLNESQDAVAVFLDVDEQAVLLMKKMNPEASEFKIKGEEILFKRWYPLEKILISLDGKIHSTFHQEYNSAMHELILDLRAKQEKNEVYRFNRFREKKPTQSYTQMSFLGFSSSTEAPVSKQEAPKAVQTQGVGRIKERIQSRIVWNIKRAKGGDEEAFQSLVRLIHSGVDEYHMMKGIFNNLIALNDEESERLWHRLLASSGFEI